MRKGSHFRSFLLQPLQNVQNWPFTPFFKLLSFLEQSISLVVLDFTKTNEVMIRIVFVLVLRFEVDP